MADEPKRICRTPDDAFAAGSADAANDRPLDLTEIARLTVLLRPHLADRKTAA